MDDKHQTLECIETMQDALISMAVESWRIIRMFELILTKQDLIEQNRYKSHLDWFLKNVENALVAADLKIVNIEGKLFKLGEAATPLNIKEFDTGDGLVVDQMLEPIIMGKDGLVKMGTVILRKSEPLKIS